MRLAISTRISMMVRLLCNFNSSFFGTSLPTVKSFVNWNVISSPRTNPDSDLSEPIPCFSLSFNRLRIKRIERIASYLKFFYSKELRMFYSTVVIKVP